jgi:large subunit ribosomal protein L29
MKVKEMRDKETGHLQHELAEQQKHLYTLRTQSVTEKLEDPSQLGKTRRQIAQLKTLLRQRELEAAKTAAKETPATPVAAKEPAAAAK